MQAPPEPRSGSPSVRVEQGPRWLVELAIDPPAWLLVVLVSIAVAVIALAALGYRRNDGLDQDVLEEMGVIGTIVFCIVVSAEMWSLAFDFGYVIDVLAGTAIGFGLAQYLIWAYYQAQEENEQLSAAEA